MTTDSLALNLRWKSSASSKTRHKDTWYAGEAATPEFSAGIEMLGAACSINLTPSHNPANYAGLKFNPFGRRACGRDVVTNKNRRDSKQD